jgi:hypothetical protein
MEILSTFAQFVAQKKPVPVAFATLLRPMERVKQRD